VVDVLIKCVFVQFFGGITAMLRNIIGALVLTAVLPVSAFDLEAHFIDPLHALPETLESGAPLPGDEEPVPCPVSKDFTTPLALAEAVDLALCNNPQIKSAWVAIKIQADSLGEARAAYLPTLSGTITQQQSHTSYPGSSVAAATANGQTIYSTLAWRLFDFGGRDANRQSANKLLLAAIANHDAVIQKTLAAVIQAYFDAMTSKAALQAKEQNEETASSTLNSAQRREIGGAVSHGDTLQAITALAKTSLDKNRARNTYQKSISILAFSVGVLPQTPFILPDDLLDKEVLANSSLNAWLEIAANTHPAIQAARAQWESAKYKIIATRSEGLPTVDFAANYYQNGYPGQGLSPTESRVKTIGVSISIPFFDGFSRTYKTRGAEAQAEQREADMQDAAHNILMEVVKTYSDAVASEQSLDASEKLLSSAQASLNTSKRKYDKGAADILEILNTQAALADAQQERIRSLSEWRSARLRLLASVGMMGRTVVNP
jgi:outer membrane protein